MPDAQQDLQQSSLEDPTGSSAGLVLVRDVIIAFALFLLACLIAGLLDDLVSVDYPNLYILWFGIALIPFAFFGHWRGALMLTWPAIASAMLSLLVLSFVPVSILDFPGGLVLFAAVVICASCIGDWLVRAAHRQHSDSTSSKT